MAEQARKAIAVIGDLIDSKAIKNRFEFQERFARDLADINKGQADSPYSMTGTGTRRSDTGSIFPSARSIKTSVMAC